MNDLISVIIPVYNREKFVKECIDSVCNQSYQNFEIVIIDDGSTDSTLEICQNYAETENRIKILTLQHFGVSNARNAGIESSNGNYLFFLDSDDIIHPRLLETLVTAMKKHNAAISGSGIINIPQSRWEKAYELIKKEQNLGETAYKTFDETLYEVFNSLTPLNLIGGVMMKRDLIGDTRFKTDVYIGEDFLFIYENLIKKPNAVFLIPKWYYCRLHNHNSSWDYSYNGFLTRFYRRELVWKSEESFGRYDYAKKQKGGALGVFTNCAKHNKPFSKETQKMSKTLRDYKKEILPALPIKSKILYVLFAYFPFSCAMLYKLRYRLNPILKRRKK